MGLIKCPECNKEISDKSKICIHCGYPINDRNNVCIINGIAYDLSFLLDKSISVPFRAKQLHLLTKCDIKDCIEKTKIVDETGEIPKTLYLIQKDLKDNKVHCPYCNSTDVKKISGTERVASIAMLGIFSKKINKSFKCGKCGGTF